MSPEEEVEGEGEFVMGPPIGPITKELHDLVEQIRYQGQIWFSPELVLRIRTNLGLPIYYYEDMENEEMPLEGPTMPQEPRKEASAADDAIPSWKRRDWLAIEKGIVIPEDTPLPAHSVDTQNGMLSPDGVLYPCDRLGHNNLCARIEKQLKIPWGRIEATWCKLSVGQWGNPCNADPTQKQLDTVFDWCHHWDRDMPYWAKPEFKPHGGLVNPHTFGLGPRDGD